MSVCTLYELARRVPITPRVFFKDRRTPPNDRVATLLEISNFIGTMSTMSSRTLNDIGSGKGGGGGGEGGGGIRGKGGEENLRSQLILHSRFQSER